MSRMASPDEIPARLRAGAAATSQPPPADDGPAIDIPRGFAQYEALARIAAYAASQLHAGLSEREIMRRLHGYVPAGEG